MSNRTNGGQEDFGDVGEDELAYDHLKGPDFRVLWTDGAVASVTPAGWVHLAIYAERYAIPRRVVYEYDADTGKIGAEKTDLRYSRNSIVRELSCDLMMTPETAAKLGDQLIEWAEKARKR